MSEHTPGPWTYEYAAPDDSMTNLVVSSLEVDAGEDGRPENFGGSLLEGFLVLDDATNAANARLIAAAPELLGALIEVRRALVPAVWQAVPHTARRLLDITNAAIGIVHDEETPNAL